MFDPFHTISGWIFDGVILSDMRMPGRAIPTAVDAMTKGTFGVLILITYIPAISTWLPTMMMGPEIITR